MSMNNYEERFARWYDGEISPDDAVNFEAELRALGLEPTAERRSAQALSDLLRRHAATPPLSGPELLNAAVLREIALEQAKAPSRVSSVELGFSQFWAWFASTGLKLATVCLMVAATALVVRWGFDGQRETAPAQGTEARRLSAGLTAGEYMAEVLKVEAGDSLIGTQVIKSEGVTVVMLEGLDRLPGSYILE
jgi:hypothetical protein